MIHGDVPFEGPALIQKRGSLEERKRMATTRSMEHITADCPVEELVRCYPQTILVLARHGLQCAGCSISTFHTIADSAREYAVAIGPLLGDLNRAIAAERAS
jgi:hybrid cluster-associated redox disulfide protein